MPRGDSTHIAGCAYRALACIGQVLFAINERYLINEKGALTEAAAFPVTIDELATRVAEIWHRIGLDAWNISRPAAFLIDTDQKILASWIGDNQTQFPSPDEILRRL